MECGTYVQAVIYDFVKKRCVSRRYTLKTYRKAVTDRA